MSDIHKILETCAEIQKSIKELNEELQDLEKLVVHYQPQSDLIPENENLKNVVQKLKEELIRLEIANGIDQIPVPSNFIKDPSVKLNLQQISPSEVKSKEVSETVNKEKANEVSETAIATKSNEKGTKKKEKAEKQTAKKQAGGESKEEPPVDVGRLDIRVGKILEVKKHPDAESLYVEQIDIGQEKSLTVVSGLVKHIPIDEMEGRLVVLLCNLKPAKMRGITSEAMVMCASTPEKVELLSPPPDAAPGDLVHVEGYSRTPDSVLNPKKKIFETVAPDLKTDLRCKATYKGALWTVPGKGNVMSQTLTEVNIK